MDFYNLSDLIVCICASIAFIYGLIRLIRLHKSVFAQLVVFAAGCVAIGRLYLVVRFLTGGDVMNKFQLGVLGTIGSLLFILSASLGTMDSIADDRSQGLRKYRIIAGLAPLAVLAFFVATLFFMTRTTLELITGCGLTVAVMLASYFNLKHLIIPDVDQGIISHIRLYNLMALIYAYLCMAQHFALSLNNETAVLVINILTGIVILVMVPAAIRGEKKWII